MRSILPIASWFAAAALAAGQTAATRRSALVTPLPDAPAPALLELPALEDSIPGRNQEEADEPENPAALAVFPNHLIGNRFWLSGQANFIFEAHGPFHSPYSGTNSLESRMDQTGLSRVLTLYTGLRLARWTEFFLDFEETGGQAIGQALGIAAFPNLDVVRNPTLSQNVYLARYFIHQTFPLTSRRIEEAPSPFSLASEVPERRMTFMLGKMSLVDFFDLNSAGSDSHLQFTNWAIDNNGAYDYAADTRGYTIAAILSYEGPQLGVHFGEALMPTVANGIQLDYDLRRARSENLEFDWKHAWFRGWETYIRPLAYLNHADMGDYGQAIEAFEDHIDPVPNITLHRHQGTLKQGFGLNLEQQLPATVRAFVRVGWNEGLHESFAYTEMNTTALAGADLSGAAWGRKQDRLGSAFESGGISQKHREYLALGGLGFILGDGRLDYRRELVSETYYNVHIAGGLFAAAQISYIDNPGYNHDRGPVEVPGMRIHLDF